MRLSSLSPPCQLLMHCAKSPNKSNACRWSQICCPIQLSVSCSFVSPSNRELVCLVKTSAYIYEWFALNDIVMCTSQEWRWLYRFSSIWLSRNLIHWFVLWSHEILWASRLHRSPNGSFCVPLTFCSRMLRHDSHNFLPVANFRCLDLVTMAQSEWRISTMLPATIVTHSVPCSGSCVPIIHPASDILNAYVSSLVTSAFVYIKPGSPLMTLLTHRPTHLYPKLCLPSSRGPVSWHSFYSKKD